MWADKRFWSFFAALALIAVFPSLVSAKEGLVIRITINSPTFASPIEITDAQTLESLNYIYGLIDWGYAPPAERQMGSAFDITYYFDDQRFQPHSVRYYLNLADGFDFVYVPEVRYPHISYGTGWFYTHVLGKIAMRQILGEHGVSLPDGRTASTILPATRNSRAPLTMLVAVTCILMVTGAGLALKRHVW